MKLGKNMDDIQKANRCMVLQLLLGTEKISRVDLARRTGLNKATITNVIQEFEQMGIVEDIGSVEASNGRKTAGITLNLSDVVTIVIRIERNAINFAICNVHGEISNFKQIKYTNDDTIDRVLEIMKSNTRELIDCCSDKKIMGISIAILGWLFRRNNKNIAKTDGFPELGKVDIKEEMEKSFPDYEVLIDHDANMSALAEWREYTKNSNITVGSMLNIVCGIGFGGGIVINGELFRGASGVAGEIGHMGINFNSRYQPRGTSPTYRGMFEDYASPRALRESVMERLMDFPNSILNENSTLQDIYDAYEKNDELAGWAVNQMARMFAYGLTGLIFILNPDVIVLGDEVIRSDRFLNQLKQHLKEFLPEMIYEVLDLRLSNFSGGGILRGSGLAMTKHYLSTYKMIDFLRGHYPIRQKDDETV